MKEYLQARFREYFKDAKAIDVSFLDDQEKTVVDVTLAVSAGPMMLTFVCEAGSDDDCFIFEDINDGRIITVPFRGSQWDQPLWRTERFNDEERKLMLSMMTEEIRDSAEAFAEEVLDAEPLVDLIAYADEDAGTTHDMLKAILDHNAGMDDYKSGEHEDHVSHAAFMERHGLVDSVGDVTPLGREYIERFG